MQAWWPSFSEIDFCSFPAVLPRGLPFVHARCFSFQQVSRSSEMWWSCVGWNLKCWFSESTESHAKVLIQREGSWVRLPVKSPLKACLSSLASPANTSISPPAQRTPLLPGAGLWFRYPHNPVFLLAATWTSSVIYLGLLLSYSKTLLTTECFYVVCTWGVSLHALTDVRCATARKSSGQFTDFASNSLELNGRQGIWASKGSSIYLRRAPCQGKGGELIISPTVGVLCKVLQRS